MNKNQVVLFLVFVLSSALLSCATPHPQVSCTPATPSQNLVQKVDSFMIIFDRSNTMERSYGGKKKLSIAKDTVASMNQSIPALKLSAALRAFGHGFLSKNETDLLYGLTDYTKEGLAQTVNEITFAGGNSPMALAVTMAWADLLSAPGPIALFIVSDFEVAGEPAVRAVREIRRIYGKKIRIYPIVVGNDPVGAQHAERIAEAGECGFAVTAESLASCGSMAGYVEKVFYKKPIDSDRDGVIDDKDKCPNTPQGAGVNKDGCWVLQGIQFDTAKSDIKPDMSPILGEVVAVLQKNPGITVEIQGHTDSVGSPQSNMKLSQDRADAVMDYLVQKGIEAERLTAKGYGLTKPIASNDTPEGRAENRRVQLDPQL